MNVQELSHDEYMAGLRCEIQTDGLIEAVKKRLDEIYQVALLLNYEDLGVVQEKSLEIIDLLKTLKPCDDAISRSALLAAYDEAHKGPPGGARKLIEEAPAVEPKVHEPKMVIGIAEIYKDIFLGNCPSCDQSIVSNANKSTKYCRFCGQAVKWDERE